MSTSTVPAIQRWHDLVQSPDTEALRDLLDDDVVFRSPAMYAPKHGKDQAETFLWAALQVLAPTLRYHQEWLDGDSAVLLFTADVNGLEVSGVDIVRWNSADRFTEFTVMIRPLKGLESVVGAIGAQLEAVQ
ncbi:nuclear transport factor 2 family protein [Rhodococcus qingshengii]|uniref:nuclear transport factor 2 family protein n=1 Tax=Rhodococcus qingshengii TaxID=334542 RepID=UPI00237D1392|nr:nuclear transport factor 2 family protein [Rhodococcus qingshengii]WCT06032.1 nuclear transport factor 2 family protein [Rhodococcus qingshengii]